MNNNSFCPLRIGKRPENFLAFFWCSRQLSRNLLPRNSLELTTSVKRCRTPLPGEIVSFPRVLCEVALYFFNPYPQANRAKMITDKINGIRVESMKSNITKTARKKIIVNQLVTGKPGILK